MRPLIAGNWKMHGLQAQLSEISALAANARLTKADVDVVICPPATLIARAVLAANGNLAIGGQDCHWAASGPCTGDISAEMLKDDGAAYVIVGHSERRQHHGETDTMVAAKARAAQRAGLTAIVCIGETSAQRKAGNAFTICAEQIAGSILSGIAASALAVAYEPLWAIGSKETASGKQIAEMHAHIRQVLIGQMGETGRTVRLLYGGSVNANTAGYILDLPDVNGVLVGRASLDLDDFEAIVACALPVAA